MTDQLKVRSVCLLSSVLFLTGCSGNDYPSKVSGVVTLDGSPVPTGRITFASSNREQPPGASKIEKDGGYYLVTNERNGVPAGAYKVAVQAFKPGPKLAPGERRFTPSEPLVPKRYHSTETSGLEYTVEPGSNRIDIALTSE